MAGSTENSSGSRWRVVAWTAAALILLLPLIAMQFTDEVAWTASDFVFAAILLFVPLGIYELVARKTGDAAYRTGIGLALLASVLIFWSSGAVGITDSTADVLYFLALVVGIVGAFVARFRPRGMARAMFATALALVLAGVIALVGGMVPAYNSVLEILGISGFFATLFIGSAALFQEAARGESEQGTS